MKKAEQFFTLVTLPVDLLMVFVAFLLAYWARSRSVPFPVIYIWPFDQYVRLALEMLPIWLVAFGFAGLYSSQRPKIQEFGQIIAGVSLGTMAVVLWVFLNRSDFFSRLIVFYIWALSIIMVGLGRIILELIRSNLYLFGFNKKKIALVGKTDQTMLHLISQIKSRPSLGYKISGIVAGEKPKAPAFNYLGHPRQIDEIIKKHHLDELLVTDTTISNEDLFFLMRECQEKEVVFKAVPTHAQVGARTLQFDAFAGIPVIEFKGTPLDSWGAVLKRVFDIIGSVIGIIILSPVMLVISILVKLDSKGPVIYRNLRLGNHGEFKTLKFRTMYIEVCTGNEYGGSRAEEIENKLIKEKNIKAGEAVYKIANDPRVTKVGSFLRRTSLDELPQFFNVLAGNMSIVGPRPHQPREIKHYTKEQRKLLLIKPGVTGLAQISGRSDLTFDEEARLDISYLENWSLLLDAYIAAKTLGAVVKGKGSY